MLSWNVFKRSMLLLLSWENFKEKLTETAEKYPEIGFIRLPMVGNQELEAIAQLIRCGMNYQSDGSCDFVADFAFSNRCREICEDRCCPVMDGLSRHENECIQIAELHELYDELTKKAGTHTKTTIDQQLFTDTIHAIQKANIALDAYEALADKFERIIHVDGITITNNATIIAELIDEIFELPQDSAGYTDFSWWCERTDYGRRPYDVHWLDNSFLPEGDPYRHPDLSTPEKLYDYMIWSRDQYN